MCSAPSERSVTELECQSTNLTNQRELEEYPWLPHTLPVHCSGFIPVIAALPVTHYWVHAAPFPSFSARTMTAESARVLVDFECSSTSQRLDPSLSEWHDVVLLQQRVCAALLRGGFPFSPAQNTRDTDSSLNMLFWLDRLSQQIVWCIKSCYCKTYSGDGNREQGCIQRANDGKLCKTIASLPLSSPALFIANQYSRPSPSATTLPRRPFLGQMIMPLMFEIQ